MKANKGIHADTLILRALVDWENAETSSIQGSFHSQLWITKWTLAIFVYCSSAKEFHLAATSIIITLYGSAAQEPRT